jgi:hypothetical protein
MDPVLAGWFGASATNVYLLARCGHKKAALGEERGEATEIIPAKRRQADLAFLAFMRR